MGWNTTYPARKIAARPVLRKQNRVERRSHSPSVGGLSGYLARRRGSSILTASRGERRTAGRPGRSEFLMDQSPAAVYRQRLELHRRRLDDCERRRAWLGNGRFLLLIAGLVLAGLAFAAGLVSPWWLVVPAVAFTPSTGSSGRQPDTPR